MFLREENDLKSILKKNFSDGVSEKTVHWDTSVVDNEKPPKLIRKTRKPANKSAPNQKKKKIVEENERLKFIVFNIPVKPVKSLEPPKLKPRLLKRQMKKEQDELEEFQRTIALYRSMPRPQSRK